MFVVDRFRNADGHELRRRCRLQVEQTLAIELAPVKDLVGVDPVRSRDHRHPGLQRFLTNAPPFLLRTMSPLHDRLGGYHDLVVPHCSHDPLSARAGSF
jgi:hypothetical protein